MLSAPGSHQTRRLLNNTNVHSGLPHQLPVERATKNGAKPVPKITLLAQDAPHTSAAVAYGTPAMAQAVMRLVKTQPTLPVLLVMAGHDEGVVAYGADVDSVTALLVDTLKRIKST